MMLKLFQYLSELALLDVDCVQYLPSKIAASAVCLAKYTIEGNIWVSTSLAYFYQKSVIFILFRK